MIFYYDRLKLYNFNFDTHQWKDKTTWHIEFISKFTETNHTNVFIDNTDDTTSDGNSDGNNADVKKEDINNQVSSTALNKIKTTNDKDRPFTMLYKYKKTETNVNNYCDNNTDLIFNSDQKKFIQYIEDIFNNMKENTSNVLKENYDDKEENQQQTTGASMDTFTLCLLLGPAGTGKTTILKYFAQDLNKYKMYYLTTQNILCRDFLKKVNIPENQVYTIASFIIKLFSTNFYRYRSLCAQLMTINCTESILLRAISCINRTPFYNNNRVTITHTVTNDGSSANSCIGVDKNKRTAIPIDSIAYHNIFPVKNNTNTGDNNNDDDLLLIFIDEFSQIQSNIIKLIIDMLKEYSYAYNRKIVLTICGDCYQIQPVASLKCNTDHSLVEFLFDYDDRSTKYTIDKIASNSLCILDNDYNHITILYEQMRNKSNVDFLNGLLEIYDKKNSNLNNLIGNYITSNINKNVINNRLISFTYNVELFNTYPYKKEDVVVNIDSNKKNEKMFLNTIAWCNLNVKLINSFVFFSYTNTDAHYINVSTFFIAYNNFYNHLLTIDDIDKKIFFKTLMPRLAVIKFANSTKDTLKYGVFNSPNLPVLPLIIGMNYKVLRWVSLPTTTNKNQKQCNDKQQQQNNFSTENDLKNPNTNEKNFYPSSGSIVTLLAINNDNLHVLYDDTFYCIRRCFFQQNLFGTFKKFQYMENNVCTQAPPDSNLYLYGFPLQLSIGDTVQSSIGRTIQNNMYANINGASFEEIYVLFSRLTNEFEILGLIF
ncbi:MAG: helicase 2 [Cotesia congregata filamentous virus 2]